MNRRMLLRAGIAIVLILVAYLAGTQRSDGERGPGPETVAGSQAEVWTCSMHPQIRLPEPGQCPICFMDLIPVSSDDAGDDGGETRLTMSESAVKLAEIRTAPVVREFPTMELRLVGKVETDETRVRTLAARTAGRLDRLYVDYTGLSVRSGDHLVWMYSPALVAAQEELLQAVQAYVQLKESDVETIRHTSGATVKAARDKLVLLGLTPVQVDDIIESGEVSDHLTIYSPIDGVVIEKLAEEGSYVSVGSPIYRLADLTRLWVKIDAYESDLEWLRFGQLVSFTTEAYPGKEFTGRISFIDPVLDPQTRTAKVRVNVDNADRLLKPGMFVRAVIHPTIASGGRVMAAELAGKWICPMHPEVIKERAGSCDVCGMALVRTESLGYETIDEDREAPLLVPASAPLITGKRAVVYVRVPGAARPTFEGREVVLGPRANASYIVREGLEEGDEVVVNGAFKIDSAMQIQARPSMMTPPDGAPAAGTKQSDAPEPFRTALGELAARVVDLSAALAEDDEVVSANVAGMLPAAVDMIPSGGLHDDAWQRWTRLEAELEAAADDMAATGDLAARRAALPALTRVVADALRSFEVDSAVEIRRFHCPMAFDNTGADWLQSGADTENPYFGAAMLRCGSQEEVLAGASR